MTDVQLDQNALTRLSEGRGTPEEATAWLAQMKTAFDGPPPTANPKNSVEAARRLQYLTSGKDPGWFDRFNRGDPETRREFDALTKMRADANEVDLALSGVAPSHLDFEIGQQGKAGLRNMVDAMPGLREAGFSDDSIREILTDQKATREQHDAARRLQTALHGNTEWRARYLAGDAEAKRQQSHISAILAADIL
jgi:hypothetical protein